eukprot:XP_001704854.1 Hypothetical protein GL50803_94022 [Giardia lamblia ATCC 50803]
MRALHGRRVPLPADGGVHEGLRQLRRLDVPRRGPRGVPAVRHRELPGLRDGAQVRELRGERRPHLPGRLPHGVHGLQRHRGHGRLGGPRGVHDLRADRQGRRERQLPRPRLLPAGRARRGSNRRHRHRRPPRPGRRRLPRLVVRLQEGRPAQARGEVHIAHAGRVLRLPPVPDMTQ